MPGLTRVTALVIVAGALGGCGTFSVLRPADNLHPGQVEISGGVAMNSLPEAVPVGQASVGVTKGVELGAQYETHSAAGWARFGLLNTDDHGIALALTAGGGAARVWRSNTNELFSGSTSDFTGALLAGATVGRRFGFAEPYLGYRVFYLPGLETAIQTIKGGVRFTGWDTLFLGLEGGVTIHHAAATLGEGALVFGLKFGGP